MTFKQLAVSNYVCKWISIFNDYSFECFIRISSVPPEKKENGVGHLTTLISKDTMLPRQPHAKQCGTKRWQAICITDSKMAYQKLVQTVI